VKTARRSLLILALALWAAPAVAAGQIAPATAADRSIGRPDAPVTVIEYGSFACPACADWHELIYPAFRQRFIDTGQVRLVFRNLPTQPEAVSLPGAALARCAAPERFFDVASALMRGQAAVLRGGTREAWYAPAVAVSGRTLAQLEACAATPATRAAITRDIDSAHAADVHSTPAFFVNGRPATDRSLGGLEVAIRAAAAGR
jgi:protein-disulfide isomerase